MYGTDAFEWRKPRIHGMVSVSWESLQSLGPVMSFFKRKGEEAPSPSCNVNGGEPQTQYRTEQSLIRCSKLLQHGTLPMAPRCCQNFVFLLPLVTAVIPASLAVASLFSLLYLVWPRWPLNAWKIYILQCFWILLTQNIESNLFSVCQTASFKLFTGLYIILYFG